MAENLVLAAVVLAGFLWLKRRARHVDLEKRSSWVLLGIFVLLPAALFLTNRFFGELGGSAWVAVGVQALILIVAFALIGLVFLPGPDRADKLPPPAE